MQAFRYLRTVVCMYPQPRAAFCLDKLHSENACDVVLQVNPPRLWVNCMSTILRHSACVLLCERQVVNAS